MNRRRMSWLLGGILLGLLNTFAVATYAALGVSRSYVVLDGVLLKVLGSDLWQTNSYMRHYPTSADWLLMIFAGMIIGGFFAALVNRGIKPRSVPKLWSSRFGDSRLKRFAAAFAGGFLLLFGARIAGGCTTGLVLSGSAQLALAGLLFSATVLASGILSARLLYDRGRR